VFVIEKKFPIGVFIRDRERPWLLRRTLFEIHTTDFPDFLRFFSESHKYSMSKLQDKIIQITKQLFVIDYIYILESITAVRLFIGYIISKCLVVRS